MTGSGVRGQPDDEASYASRVSALFRHNERLRKRGRSWNCACPVPPVIPSPLHFSSPTPSPGVVFDRVVDACCGAAQGDRSAGTARSSSPSRSGGDAIERLLDRRGGLSPHARPHLRGSCSQSPLHPERSSGRLSHLRRRRRDSARRLASTTVPSRTLKRRSCWRSAPQDADGSGLSRGWRGEELKGVVRRLTGGKGA